MAKKKEQSERHETIKKSIDWYIKERPLFEKLSLKIENIVREILEEEGINIHAINSRAKEIDSFAKKIEDPKYVNPQVQIMDLAGIRIIAYVEDDAKKICTIIEKFFDIDDENSINKDKELGTNKVGYRSVHYIAKLRSERLKLPEYKKFTNKVFEIQVRTILQHAWAEIEHDRNYKFSGKLPNEIERQFSLLAGNIELLDKGFNSLAREIDKEVNEVEKATKKGDLYISINTTTLKQFLLTKFDSLINKYIESTFANNETIILDELKRFGLITLDDLNKIIPNDYEKNLKLILDGKTNFLGILRDFMIIHNYKKYFKDAWAKNWSAMDPETVELLKKYKIPLSEIVNYGIDM